MEEDAVTVPINSDELLLELGQLFASSPLDEQRLSELADTCLQRIDECKDALDTVGQAGSAQEEPSAVDDACATSAGIPARAWTTCLRTLFAGSFDQDTALPELLDLVHSYIAWNASLGLVLLQQLRHMLITPMDPAIAHAAATASASPVVLEAAPSDLLLVACVYSASPGDCGEEAFQAVAAVVQGISARQLSAWLAAYHARGLTHVTDWLTETALGWLAAGSLAGATAAAASVEAAADTGAALVRSPYPGGPAPVSVRPAETASAAGAAAASAEEQEVGEGKRPAPQQTRSQCGAVLLAALVWSCPQLARRVLALLLDRVGAGEGEEDAGAGLRRDRGAAGDDSPLWEVLGAVVSDVSRLLDTAARLRSLELPDPAADDAAACPNGGGSDGDGDGDREAAALTLISELCGEGAAESFPPLLCQAQELLPLLAEHAAYVLCMPPAAAVRLVRMLGPLLPYSEELTEALLLGAAGMASAAAAAAAAADVAADAAVAEAVAKAGNALEQHGAAGAGAAGSGGWQTPGQGRHGTPAKGRGRGDGHCNPTPSLSIGSWGRCGATPASARDQRHAPRRTYSQASLASLLTASPAGGPSPSWALLDARLTHLHDEDTAASSHLTRGADGAHYNAPFGSAATDVSAAPGDAEVALEALCALLAHCGSLPAALAAPVEELMDGLLELACRAAAPGTETSVAVGAAAGTGDPAAGASSQASVTAFTSCLFGRVHAALAASSSAARRGVGSADSAGGDGDADQEGRLCLRTLWAARLASAARCCLDSEQPATPPQPHQPDGAAEEHRSRGGRGGDGSNGGGDGSCQFVGAGDAGHGGSLACCIRWRMTVDGGSSGLAAESRRRASRGGSSGGAGSEPRCGSQSPAPLLLAVAPPVGAMLRALAQALSASNGCDTSPDGCGGAPAAAEPTRGSRGVWRALSCDAQEHVAVLAEMLIRAAFGDGVPPTEAYPDGPHPEKPLQLGHGTGVAGSQACAGDAAAALLQLRMQVLAALAEALLLSPCELSLALLRAAKPRLLASPRPAPLIATTRTTTTAPAAEPVGAASAQPRSAAAPTASVCARACDSAAGRSQATIGPASSAMAGSGVPVAASGTALSAAPAPPATDAAAHAPQAAGAAPAGAPAGASGGVAAPNAAAATTADAATDAACGLRSSLGEAQRALRAAVLLAEECCGKAERLADAAARDAAGPITKPTIACTVGSSDASDSSLAEEERTAVQAGVASIMACHSALQGELDQLLLPPPYIPYDNGSGSGVGPEPAEQPVPGAAKGVPSAVVGTADVSVPAGAGGPAAATQASVEAGGLGAAGERQPEGRPVTPPVPPKPGCKGGFFVLRRPPTAGAATGGASAAPAAIGMPMGTPPSSCHAGPHVRSTLSALCPEPGPTPRSAQAPCAAQTSGSRATHRRPFRAARLDTWPVSLEASTALLRQLLTPLASAPGAPGSCSAPSLTLGLSAQEQRSRWQLLAYGLGLARGPLAAAARQASASASAACAAGGYSGGGSRVHASAAAAAALARQLRCLGQVAVDAVLATRAAQQEALLPVARSSAEGASGAARSSRLREQPVRPAPVASAPHQPSQEEPATRQEDPGPKVGPELAAAASLGSATPRAQVPGDVDPARKAARSSAAAASAAPSNRGSGDDTAAAAAAPTATAKGRISKQLASLTASLSMFTNATPVEAGGRKRRQSSAVQPGPPTQRPRPSPASQAKPQSQPQSQSQSQPLAQAQSQAPSCSEPRRQRQRRQHMLEPVKEDEVPGTQPPPEGGDVRALRSPSAAQASAAGSDAQCSTAARRRSRGSVGSGSLQSAAAALDGATAVAAAAAVEHSDTAAAATDLCAARARGSPCKADAAPSRRKGTRQRPNASEMVQLAVTMVARSPAASTNPSGPAGEAAAAAAAPIIEPDFTAPVAPSQTAAAASGEPPLPPAEAGRLRRWEVGAAAGHAGAAALRLLAHVARVAAAHLPDAAQAPPDEPGAAAAVCSVLLPPATGTFAKEPTAAPEPLAHWNPASGSGAASAAAAASMTTPTTCISLLEPLLASLYPAATRLEALRTGLLCAQPGMSTSTWHAARRLAEERPLAAAPLCALAEATELLQPPPPPSAQPLSTSLAAEPAIVTEEGLGDWAAARREQVSALVALAAALPESRAEDAKGLRQAHLAEALASCSMRMLLDPGSAPEDGAAGQRHSKPLAARPAAAPGIFARAAGQQHQPPGGRTRLRATGGSGRRAAAGVTAAAASVLSPSAACTLAALACRGADSKDVMVIASQLLIASASASAAVATGHAQPPSADGRGAVSRRWRTCPYLLRNTAAPAASQPQSPSSVPPPAWLEDCSPVELARVMLTLPAAVRPSVLQATAQLRAAAEALAEAPPTPVSGGVRGNGAGGSGAEEDAMPAVTGLPDAVATALGCCARAAALLQRHRTASRMASQAAPHPPSLASGLAAGETVALAAAAAAARNAGGRVERSGVAEAQTEERREVLALTARHVLAVSQCARAAATLLHCRATGGAAFAARPHAGAGTSVPRVSGVTGGGGAEGGEALPQCSWELCLVVALGRYHMADVDALLEQLASSGSRRLLRWSQVLCREVASWQAACLRLLHCLDAVTAGAAAAAIPAAATAAKAKPAGSHCRAPDSPAPNATPTATVTRFDGATATAPSRPEARAIAGLMRRAMEKVCGRTAGTAGSAAASPPSPGAAVAVATATAAGTTASGAPGGLTHAAHSRGHGQQAEQQQPLPGSPHGRTQGANDQDIPHEPLCLLFGHLDDSEGTYDSEEAASPRQHQLQDQQDSPKQQAGQQAGHQTDRGAVIAAPAAAAPEALHAGGGNEPHALHAGGAAPEALHAGGGNGPQALHAEGGNGPHGGEGRSLHLRPGHGPPLREQALDQLSERAQGQHRHQEGKEGAEQGGVTLRVRRRRAGREGEQLRRRQGDEEVRVAEAPAAGGGDGGSAARAAATRGLQAAVAAAATAAAPAATMPGPSGAAAAGRRRVIKPVAVAMPGRQGTSAAGECGAAAAAPAQGPASVDATGTCAPRSAEALMDRRLRPQRIVPQPVAMPPPAGPTPAAVGVQVPSRIGHDNAKAARGSGTTAQPPLGPASTSGRASLGTAAAAVAAGLAAAGVRRPAGSGAKAGGGAAPASTREKGEEAAGAAAGSNGAGGKGRGPGAAQASGSGQGRSQATEGGRSGGKRGRTGHGGAAEQEGEEGAPGQKRPRKLNAACDAGDEARNGAEPGKTKARRRAKQRKQPTNPFIAACLRETGGRESGSDGDWSDLEDFIVCQPDRDYSALFAKKYGYAPDDESDEEQEGERGQWQARTVGVQ